MHSKNHIYSRRNEYGASIIFIIRVSVIRIVFNVLCRLALRRARPDSHMITNRHFQVRANIYRHKRSCRWIKREKKFANINRLPSAHTHARLSIFAFAGAGAVCDAIWLHKLQISSLCESCENRRTNKCKEITSSHKCVIFNAVKVLHGFQYTNTIVRARECGRVWAQSTSSIAHPHPQSISCAIRYCLIVYATKRGFRFHSMTFYTDLTLLLNFLSTRVRGIGRQRGR